MSSPYDDRIEELARRAETVADGFDPDPPAHQRALSIVSDGVGPTVAVYCEARTGESWVRFSQPEFDRLEATLNRWLSLYGACYGVELSGGYSIRTAAELLVDTHDAQAVAAALTGVPEQ